MGSSLVIRARLTLNCCSNNQKDPIILTLEPRTSLKATDQLGLLKREELHFAVLLVSWLLDGDKNLTVGGDFVEKSETSVVGLAGPSEVARSSDVDLKTRWSIQLSVRVVSGDLDGDLKAESLQSEVDTLVTLALTDGVATSLGATGIKEVLFWLKDSA